MRVNLKLLALIIGFTAGSAPAAAVDERFKADVQAYLGASDAKAFAVAEDTEGAAAWGFGYSQASVEEAVKVALAVCTVQRQKSNVKNECAVVMVGNALLSSSGTSQSPSPTEAPRQPAYETRWVNGVGFLIGSSRDVQVWVAFFKGKDPHALIYLVNAGDSSATFAPESIRARYLRQEKGGLQESSLKTFGADEYEKKVRNRQAFTAALLGAAVALSNQPQPQTSTLNGGYTAVGPNGYGYGSFSGTITQWPTAGDYAEANARTAAQVQALASQLERSFQSMASTLMKTHTLAPGSYYGGIVHFERHRGTGVRLNIPFGEETFSFEFTY